ncbi:MAG: hypothetical protein M1831_007255 [Alyxoria varia]|nr:MAG: hypothetical protein M1831_007255 [Alyxoria varia]
MIGLETISLILAIFPLVISGLEHYEEGFQSMKEWYKFRAEFALFVNKLAQQKIFFRQNIENLLSPAVQSDYDLTKMLDDPNDGLWRSQKLESRLRARLAGINEYECYMLLLIEIHRLLNKLRRKLKIEPAKGLGKVEYEFRRVSYTLGRSRRQALLTELERNNNDLQKLLGNSDMLEPIRRVRNNTLPKAFERIRMQAASLHAAVLKALLCDCSVSHSTSLLLSKDNESPSSQNSENETSTKLSMYFPLKSGAWSSSYTLSKSTDGWYAAEAEMDTNEECEGANLQTIRSGTSDVSKSSRRTSSSRKVSFVHSLDTKSSTTSSIPEDAIEIIDICAALKSHEGTEPNIGFLRDPFDRLHLIKEAPTAVVPPSQIGQAIKLDSILQACHEPEVRQALAKSNFSRRKRLSVALTMAKTLLKLHPGPLLKSNWSKQDICFFQDHDKVIQTDHPLLLIDFGRKKRTASTPLLPVPSNEQITSLQTSRSSVLALGILILEMWFNQAIESHPLHQQFLGPNGSEMEFTNFNTAQKWQEQALEEGGLDLHNITWRCIYCAFGSASQDLNDKELRRAVYDEVAIALERLVAGFGEG